MKWFDKKSKNVPVSSLEPAAETVAKATSEAPGFKALQTAGTDLWESTKKAGANLWAGTEAQAGKLKGGSRGLADRAAGALAKTTAPVRWVLKRPVLGPVALVAGAATAGMAIKNHYSNRRDEFNAMAYDPNMAVTVYPTYKNSVTPQEAAALDARLKQGNPQNAAFASAVEEQRANASEPQKA